MEKQEETKRRVSGVHPYNSREGKVSYYRMSYPKIVGDEVVPDCDAMLADINAYLDSQTSHNPAGYRKALKDISPATLALWQAGYMCHADSINTDIEPNEELIKTMDIGRNALIDKLYQQDGKYQSQLVIRTLEGMGELTPQKKIVDVSLSGLGKWEKWSK